MTSGLSSYWQRESDKRHEGGGVLLCLAREVRLTTTFSAGLIQRSKDHVLSSADTLFGIPLGRPWPDILLLGIANMRRLRSLGSSIHFATIGRLTIVDIARHRGGRLFISCGNTGRGLHAELPRSG